MGWRIALVFVLVLANAFFVAAEFGLVAVRRTRIEELASAGSRRALSAKKALREINLMLSSCQLGITFASLGLGAIGEPVLAELFRAVFDFLSAPFGLIATHAAAVTAAFALITALHVILGELVPKNLAIAAPEGTALWLAAPIRGFTFLFRPFIWLFNESANVVVRLMGIVPQPEMMSLHTPEELAIIIGESRAGGSIGAREGEMLARTLEFPEKRAVEAMVPRTAAEALPADAGMKQLLERAEKTGFSRFPVWKQRPDEFVGVVHLKDMLHESNRNPEVTAGDVAKAPLLVPESLPIGDVLIRMQRERNHFAIVLDEFGSTSGIITMEDILEELVGEIRDEYDAREKQVRRVEGGLRVPGSLRADELQDQTGCKLPDGEYETLAGFILEQLGRMAKRGDEVSVDGWKIRVANVRRRRIISVDVHPPAQRAAGG